MAEKAPDTVGSPMARLGRFLADAPMLKLDDAVIAKAKVHVADTLAAIISGTRLPNGRAFLDYAARSSGHQESSIPGTGRLVPRCAAALVNGMLAHADETDDSHAHSLSHPGCAVVPAALAWAEAAASSGMDLLKATVVGYDFVARVNMALDAHRFFRRGFSTHSIGGTWGATAACAVLAKLDERQCRHALSYAAQQASGTSSWSRDTHHMLKAFVFGGMPARNGIASAEMVACGLTGIDDVLSGTGAFLSTFSDTAKPDVMLDGLGERFSVMDTTIKKWCVGSPIQAALDALEVLMQQEGVTYEAVERLTVRLPSDAAYVVDDAPMPNISVQHCLALLLVDGRLTFDSLHDESRMADQTLRDLRSRLALVADDSLVGTDPPRQAIVEVSTRDGRRLIKRTHAVHGTPANPMSTAELRDKVLDLIGPVFGTVRAERLYERLMALEAATDMNELRELWSVA